MSKYFSFIICFLVCAELGLSIRHKGKNQTLMTPKKLKQFYANGTSYDKLDPDFCFTVPKPENGKWPALYPHPNNCWQFIWCWDDGYLLEGECDYPLYFDIFDGECRARENVTCLEDLEDGKCPPAGSDEIVFLPSYENCEWYYVCINGIPQPMECSPGLHWNINTNRCENPRTAGCIVS